MIGSNPITTTAYLGNLLLYFSLACSVLSPRFVNLAFYGISSSLLLLIYCYIVNDFSLLIVYSHSSSSLPSLYKVAGLWASPEGSLLLFVWVLSLYNALYSYFADNKNIHKKITLEIQSAICALFTIFIILTSNPFQINNTKINEGIGLNPLLQDIALLIHPPILYIGYVGFSIIFSISIAYCYKPYQLNIGKLLKPWILLAWSFLTLGIGLGSWWAYRELGWGGFWFWDPVENISLIPWILGTALIHAILLVTKYNILERWVVFLSIVTFIMTIIGTFLVRSGILNSVHSFAENPEQMIYVVILTLILNIGGMISYVTFHKNHTIKSNDNTHLFSYQNSILLNNYFLIITALIILIGILSPLFIAYFKSSSIIIPASYYDSILQKFLLPFLFIWIIGPQLIIKRDIIKKNILPIFISILLTLALKVNSLIFSLLLFLSLWLFSSLLFSYLIKIGVFRNNISHILRSMITINKSYYSMLFTHLGGSMLIFSIICNSYFSIEKEKYMNIGDEIKINKYKLTLNRVLVEEKDNYKTFKAIFNVNNSFQITPEIRFYKIEEQSTAETVIHRDTLSDLYVLISEIDEKLGIGVQLHYNKLINLIWLSVIIIFFGGLLGVRMRNI